jgi:hypothetical protein
MSSGASNSTSFRIGLFRRGRLCAPADVGARIHAVLHALGEQHPACAKWFATDRSFEVKRRRRLEEVVEQIEGAEIEWDEGMRAPDAPSFETRFFNMGAGEGDRADVLVAFALEADPLGPHWGLRVDVQLGAVFGAGAPPDATRRLRELFATCIRAVEPDWAFLGMPKIPARIGRRVSAGWLTYISGAHVPGRAPSPPAEVDRLDSLGHVIVACPEMDGDALLRVEAVTAVQRALDGETEAPAVHAVAPKDETESRWARWAGAQRLGSTEHVDVVALRQAMGRTSAALCCGASMGAILRRSGEGRDPQEVER